VVPLDLLDSGRRFLKGLEPQEALPGWQGAGKAGVLDNHRPARRQVTGAALAEPTAAHGYVDVLGRPDLATRPGEDLQKLGWRQSRPRPVHDLPPAARQTFERHVPAVEGHLERHAHVPGQLDQLLKLTGLALVFHALVKQLALEVGPGGDRRPRGRPGWPD